MMILLMPTHANADLRSGFRKSWGTQKTRFSKRSECVVESDGHAIPMHDLIAQGGPARHRQGKDTKRNTPKAWLMGCGGKHEERMALNMLEVVINVRGR